jgi:hypothetical protein
LEILATYVREVGDDAELWMEMGRVAPEGAERFRCLLEARLFGSTQPNLLVWIARTAIEIGDVARAEATANELLTLNAAMRDAHGDALEWTEQREKL